MTGGYGNFGDVRGRLTGEQIGVHGQYDMWGLTRAYSTGDTSATAEQMQTYADTVVHEITLQIDPFTGAATYAGYNDRCCSTRKVNPLFPCVNIVTLWPMTGFIAGFRRHTRDL